MPCANHSLPNFMQLREATQSSASNHSASLENTLKMAPRMTVIEEPRITTKKPQQEAAATKSQEFKQDPHTGRMIRCAHN